MSQLIIIQSGFRGEMAGANMPPPPERPWGVQPRSFADEERFIQLQRQGTQRVRKRIGHWCGRR
jgi:hypothetical protein